jgi:fucose permease
MNMQSNGGFSGGSQTAVMEMEPATSGSEANRPEVEEAIGTLPTPTVAVPVLQKWNNPRINMFRVFATFYSFVILGLNDGAYGALIPYLEEYYNISYIVISLVFLSPVIGYIGSAATNNMVHMHFGRRGVAAVCAGSHLIAYAIISVHPPYPVLVLVFIIAGYGNGLADSGWNAWIGDMANANEVLGFLHACYGLGGAISPLVATTLVTKAGWKWYEYYYIMVGIAAIEAVFSMSAFWGATGPAYRAEHPRVARTESSTPEEGLIPETQSKSRLFRISTATRSKSRTAEAVANKITWLCSLFLLIYVGIEVSIGGWVVTFMLRVRHGTPFASGLTSTGFWGGITVGRIVLGFVTARLFKTEKHAVATYLVASIVLQLLFWVIPNFDVSAVMVAFLGFFLAPLFPAAVVAATKLLPKHLHVAAVGFASAFGASGACILPFAVGAIAQVKGVKVLQPIVLAMLVVALGVWLWIPKLPKVRVA